MQSRMASGLKFGNRIIPYLIFFLTYLWAPGLSGAAPAFDWDLQPPIPDYDARNWEKVKVLWDSHYEGKNIDEMIVILKQLEDAHPGRFEPVFMLARAHYLHARYISKDRDGHFNDSERYALQACKIAPGNVYALAVLIETLCYSRSHDYIFNNYRALIMSYAPIASAEALKDMAYDGWGKFKELWLDRADIEKAMTAAAMVEAMADNNPADGLAQTWAARANYYTGEYYTSTGEHDSKGIPYYKKGLAYAAKARELVPNSVPANYWYQINRARIVQFTNLLNKGLYLMDILRPLYFCSRENSIYYFAGPMLTLATMITNGGWVTEKGMHLANISLDMVMNGLEIAEIVFPNYYYIPFARADILAYKGRTKEALAILENIMTRDPAIDPLIPENHIFIRLAKRLFDEIQQGKY